MKLNFKKIINSFIVLNIMFTVNAQALDSSYAQNKTPEVVAESAILIDAFTGAVIYEKNKDKITFPASTTKIMTALLVLEDENFDLNNRVYFSRNAIYSTPLGSSHIAMNEDETLSTEEALHALLLASANEVSNALAEHVSGNIATFAKRMTERAKELGALNTNFLNPHGFHDENHYSTAHDIALIMREAIKHPEFVKIINTKQYKIPPTEKQELERIINNNNRLVLPGNFNYPYIVGGKPGYTNESRHTLVSYAKKDNMNLISVVLQNEGIAIFTDTINLFDYGFTQFEDVLIADKNTFKEKINIIDSSSENENIIGTSEVILNEDIILTLPKISIDKIVKNLDMPSYVYDLLIKGEIAGSLQLLYDDTVIYSSNLFANETVNNLNNKSLSSPKNPSIFIINNIFMILKKLNIYIISFFCLFLFIVYKIIEARKYRAKIRYIKQRHRRLRNNTLSKKGYGYK